MDIYIHANQYNRISIYKTRAGMEAMLRSMLNKLAIIVFLQVPHSSMCISLDGTQETPE